MIRGARAEDEERVRAACAEGRFDHAAELALRTYGGEVFELLTALHRDEADASDAFAMFAEGVWRGLARFAWDASLRTWSYAIARRASLRHRRDTRRREARQTALPEGSALAIAEEVRTATLSYLRTERRDRFAALRASLPEEDQALLLLRIDRRLAWNDLAEVLHAGDEPIAEADKKREAQRLRKRFQVVKERLYEMARAEGLVASEPDDG